MWMFQYFGKLKFYGLEIEVPCRNNMFKKYFSTHLIDLGSRIVSGIIGMLGMFPPS